MKQSFIPPTPPALDFSINLATLDEAVKGCNLGLGDLATPITANALIKSPAVDIPVYFSGEIIVITITAMFDLEPPGGTNTEGVVKLVNGTIQNVTKDLNLDPNATVDLMNKTFKIGIEDPLDTSVDARLISLLPDGTIYMEPSDTMTCEIEIREDAFKDSSYDAIYVSYGIKFSLSGLGAGYPDPYYFSIDPLLKISSGNRPGNIENVADTNE